MPGEAIMGYCLELIENGEHCLCWDEGKVCCGCGQEKDSRCDGSRLSSGIGDTKMKKTKKRRAK